MLKLVNITYIFFLQQLVHLISFLNILKKSQFESGENKEKLEAKLPSFQQGITFLVDSNLIGSNFTR